ncbi:hypothetical protein FGADI_12399 [Fusarium gaditjirri]|uniref:2EXR domain-containing protein n=1 Tax=Fusarium gaditjirri TaxID=282569 RepID=A0A8H4SSS5_9HYPO|nr:hypothetical protein FGADI_12399 [Fusarium gaditjirri]
MVSSSFHLFSRLPAELRLQVWNAACVFSRSNSYGVHYVDIEASSDGSALLIHHNPTTDVDDESSKSACQPLPLASLSIRETGGVWNVPVCPTKDIFCIKASNWSRLREYHDLWKVFLPVNGLSSSIHLPVDNIALEFDPAWNKDLPESDYDLMSEESERGFLSRFFYNSYLNNSTNPTFWIIEKTGQWTWNPSYRGETSQPFLDYHMEYIQVQPYNRCHHCHNYHHLDGVFESIRDFLHKLGDMGRACEQDHPNYQPSSIDDVEYGAFCEQFVITSGGKYLARRNKKVDLCTLEEDMARFPTRRYWLPDSKQQAGPSGARLDDDSDIEF